MTTSALVAAESEISNFNEQLWGKLIPILGKITRER